MDIDKCHPIPPFLLERSLRMDRHSIVSLLVFVVLLLGLFSTIRYRTTQMLIALDDLLNRYVWYRNPLQQYRRPRPVNPWSDYLSQNNNCTKRPIMSCAVCCGSWRSSYFTPGRTAASPSPNTCDKNITCLFLIGGSGCIRLQSEREPNRS